MCGIVGLIDNIRGYVPPRLLHAMTDSMFNRGPDGKGYYRCGAVAMGMRRLSVVDPRGGWQPFFSRCGRIIAFQNGEIYNYRELRRQLKRQGHEFISHSDTEVLAAGFREWGMDGLLERLDGMYALAILDLENRKLHLARDRFGEKPLFYTHSKGRFAYSSNLMTLAALPWVADDLEVRALDFYLALHYVPGSATIIKSINRVLPGEHLTIFLDSLRCERRRYYLPGLGNQKRIPDGDLISIIEAAVESRLMADVPVGVFLSGGLDSSIIAAVAARKYQRISTFSIGFNSAEHDESPYAAFVAKAIGSNHHHFLFDEESFRSLLPKVAAVLDEPIGDQALLPLYLLCQEARSRVTVALSGEGADEVFAGYSYYLGNTSGRGMGDIFRAHAGRFRSNYNRPQRLIYNALPQSPSGFPLLTDIAARRRLMGQSVVEPNEWEENLFAWLNQAVGLQRSAATDIATWLPDDLLVKFDRMAMAHSLEGRSPYLSPQVVEAGLALPPSQKVYGVKSKVALRRVAQKWLPPSIINRPKQGFVLPMRRWLSQWFENKVSVHDYFIERFVPDLVMTEVAQLVRDDLLSGLRRERLLFALVLLVEWYQSFKERESTLANKYREASIEEGGSLHQALP